MSRHLALFALALSAMPVLPVFPVAAASFDCAKAATAFEKAICGSSRISAADERLAKTYETAIGGLSEKALAAVRADQRSWLDFAQRACTTDAKPLTEKTETENTENCLVGIFNGRSAILEASRMIDGKRFYPRAQFTVLPDPDAASEEGSPWSVAQHELSYVQIDSEDPFALAFNAYVEEQAKQMTAGPGVEEQPDGSADPSSDSINSILVKEVAAGRVSLDVNTYWYGHGAAHGNYAITFLHYLMREQRPLEAKDIFAGKRWQEALLKLAVEALKAEHGDNLMLDDTQYIAEPVADPSRWDLSDSYALILQFEPYEVAAYAYGAPTAHIPWEKLQPLLSENVDDYRY